MDFTIAHILLTSLFIIGLNSITRKGKLFALVTNLFTSKGENRFSLANVFSECLLCMSSLYGLIGYCVLTAKITHLSLGLYFNLILITLSSLNEIRLSYRIQRKKNIVAQKSIKLASTATKCLYISLILYFIAINNIWFSLVFISSCAGLLSLVQYFITGVSAKVQNSKNIEAQTNVIINSVTLLSEQLKNK